MSISIQGTAATFGKVFVTEGKAYILKSGCFGSLNNKIGLQIDHNGEDLTSTKELLKVYAGDDALVFRCSMNGFEHDLSEQTDTAESYLPVSAALK